MLGFVTRALSGAVAPLIDRVSTVSARLLRKAVFFLIAAACLLVVLAALTAAFFLWIASLAGSIVGALAVAGIYLLVAIVAIILALRDPKPAATVRQAASADAAAQQASARQAKAGLNAQIDQFTAPLLDLLAKIGFRREQFAVLAGASIAKQLGPLPLVGLAIVGGFLLGRMGKSWRSLLSLDLIASLLPPDLFGRKPTEDDKVEPA